MREIIPQIASDENCDKAQKSGKAIQTPWTWDDWTW